MPEETVARIEWFIRLRWLAAVGVLAFAAFGRILLQLQFTVTPFVFVAVWIALYNTGFLLLVRRTRLVGKWGDGFASIQVGIDILVLTVLMHLGGGIENPFISYYLFHTIITAILLSWRKVCVQVLLASVCIAGLAIAELTGILAHRHIGGFFAGRVLC